jgi:hypothetical protein
MYVSAGRLKSIPSKSLAADKLAREDQADELGCASSLRKPFNHDVALDEAGRRSHAMSPMSPISCRDSESAFALRLSTVRPPYDGHLHMIALKRDPVDDHITWTIHLASQKFPLSARQHRRAEGAQGVFMRRLSRVLYYLACEVRGRHLRRLPLFFFKPVNP